MRLTIDSAVAAFGARAKEKLNNPSAAGSPEDQLRAPFEQLLGDLAELSKLNRADVVAVGESSLYELKTRPDYAVTLRALIGHVELKAPGKGADPRKYKDAHDKAQWERLRSLPNLIYTDGNEFSRWESGKLADGVIRLVGDIESSGDKLRAPLGFLPLFEHFLRWSPLPPKTARELAKTSAHLCRLLRDEVTEQLSLGNEALTSLAEDWRKVLFPDASDERFADGYAQAVTFGLLMAKAKGINLSDGFERIARELGRSSSLIGAALHLLTDNVQNQQTLKTSLATLTRVLDVVDWQKISKGSPDAWLYFYEDFLEVYDNSLRKRTGSYYTPPEVVGAMVRLVDECLRSSRFRQHAGLAARAITLADPALGTGTFLLGVLRTIADSIASDEGEGSVSAAINSAVTRLAGFEVQLGPFAVAQLRILAEIVQLTRNQPTIPPRIFVTDTLGNPFVEQEWLPTMYRAIGESRREANKLKREEPITVVLGNPPYKEKAKGRGGWIEGENAELEKSAPLADWMPPRDWGAGAHTKHLRNLYVYFWRWATWKVFDHGPGKKTGIVCFITVAGFLSGPGFQKMRDYLRRTCDDIWIIDCSPEGHQPEVNTRIFQAVQQPVCIMIASRSFYNDPTLPASVRFISLPLGHRTEKFKALGKLRLDATGWLECPNDWRAPFLPASSGAWATYPKLEDLFIYNGSGSMPGRTWIIAPDVESLERRWNKLISSPTEEKENLFHPHLLNKAPGDRHSKKVVATPLAGYERRIKPVADDQGACVTPARYAFRSFDRQWIIPDSRLINRPNPELWRMHSDQQIYLTALVRTSPTSGPAVTITANIPDIDHYKGSFGGRAFPLWRDADAHSANFPPKLLPFVAQRLGLGVTAEDFFAYIVGIAAHPAFTGRFQDDLSTPGLRIPITTEAATFAETVALGRTVVWLHTFGERMADPAHGRPAKPPRLAPEKRPRIPAAGAIPQDAASMPDEMEYDAATKRLRIGSGYVENVPPAVWNYAVSGKQVLTQWFSYRKHDRSRPLIGDKRPPSSLGNIQPEHWLAEYTTELINVLNVLGSLVELEPQQAALLERVCDGALISAEDMCSSGAFEVPKKAKSRKGKSEGDSYDLLP